MWFDKPLDLPSAGEALPGRDTPMPVGVTHAVNGHPIVPPFPAGLQQALFGLGCFWGAERRFWEQPGVYSTAVGYAGGHTPNPTYQEVCTGLTGHNEVVLVIFDPQRLHYADLLRIFWEAHDPTQGMRQGNDIGTTYRSAIYAESVDDIDTALKVRDAFQEAMIAAGRKQTVTTQIAPAGPFYYAEDYHQQYLAKNPDGYCSLRGIGVTCPLPVAS